MASKYVDANRLLRTRPTFSSSQMVSVAVTKLECTELFFVEPGVKVNGEYYRKVLLMKNMLPAIWGMSSDFFIFQQDSAPAHRANDAIALMRRRGATRNLSWGCSTFWGKAHPPLVSSALHSPSSSCTRCFPATLNMSSLPLTLKRVVWGYPPEFFKFFKLKAGGPGSSPEFFKMSTSLR